jgi:membrane protease YdiL (CAAX protease family)
MIASQDVSQTLGGEPALTTAQTCLSGLVLACGGLALAPLARALLRRIYPERVVFFARWRFLHLLQAVLLGALGTLVAGAYLHRGSRQPQFLESLGASAAVMATVVLLVAALARRFDPEGPRSLGLRAGGNLRAALGGLLCYLLLLPTLAGLGLLWPYLWERLGGQFEPQAVALGLLDVPREQLWIAAILAVAVVPFMEELLFRGFLQPLLVQNLGDRGGVAVTAALFAALHGGSAFLPIFGLALVLGGVMLRTQRLGAVFAIHALHNGLMFWGLVNLESMRQLVPPAPAALPGWLGGMP